MPDRFFAFVSVKIEFLVCPKVIVIDIHLISSIQLAY